MSKLARVQIEEMIPATAAPFGVRYMFDEDPDGSYGWVNRAAGDLLTASRPEERAKLITSFRTRFILEYFGEEVEADWECANCDACDQFGKHRISRRAAAAAQ